MPVTCGCFLVAYKTPWLQVFAELDRLFSTSGEQQVGDQFMEKAARDEIAGRASVETVSLAGKVTNNKSSKDRARENHTRCREAQLRNFCQEHDSYKMSAEAAVVYRAMASRRRPSRPAQHDSILDFQQRAMHMHPVFASGG